MIETRQKQVHLGNLGITVAVLYSGLLSPCRIGIAVMSPIDRMAKYLMSPTDTDPWSPSVGSSIAVGRALQQGRGRTMMRAKLPESDIERLLELLIAEDEVLKALLKVAKRNPSEQLFARLAGTSRALRHVCAAGIAVGRTWDRRLALAFGASPEVRPSLQGALDNAVCAGE